MKREVGLWIDLTKAIIVTVTGETEATIQIRSNIEKHVRFSGGSRSRPLYGTRSVSAEGKQDPNLASCLGTYYDGVVSIIRHADSIWIFGPAGEAKGELEKYLQRSQLQEHITGIETADKMTDRQVTDKVCQHYQIWPVNSD